MMCRLASGFMLLAFSAILAVPQARAQQLPDPETVRRLLEQRQQGQDRIGLPSPVDVARERANSAKPDIEAPEQEPKFRPLSAIERDYNARLGFAPGVLEPEMTLKPEQLLTDEERAGRAERETERRQLLRQFGYDMLKRAPAASRDLVGRVSDSYRLGVGDEVVITLVGSTNRSLSTRVDREGRVVAGDLPPVPAAGRSFGEFQEDFKALVARSMLGTEAYLSIGALRRMKVTVLGAVAEPGLIEAGSESDVIEILANAGGVAHSGSLRRIVIQSPGRQREVDLYRILDGSAATDLRLMDGDRVIVPLIGPTIGVAGDVVRPGIYELLPDERLTAATALALAGGTIRPRGFLIDRNRVDDSGSQKFSGIDDQAVLLAGDLLRVAPQRSNQTGTVSLEGHVLRSGQRSLDTNPGIAALLQGGDALRPDPYLLFAVLERTDPTTLQRIYRPVDLAPIVAGISDIALEDRDRLIVAGTEDIRYLANDSVRLAILSPGSLIGTRSCRAIEELSRRARQADSERLAAIARSVFVVSAIGRTEELDQQPELGDTGAAADEVVSERILARTAGLMLGCNKLFEEFPPLLPLFIEYSAVVSGAVRVPGVFPVAEQTSLRALAAAAGGLSLSADPTEIEVTRYRPIDGSPLGTPSREVYSLADTNLSEIDIGPGTVARIGARAPMLESGTVLLSGEFGRPGVYAVRKGETLSEVIARAGGVTDQAYPFGAVFTRESVKREQQESFRRTARELNNALALAIMKNDISGDALTAAAGLVSSFATVEAAGRVVVEADPLILAREPERDILLEGGDAIFMPKRPNFVLTAGDVLNPGALQFAPGKRVENYLDETGGFQETADDDRVFIVFPNGVAQPVALSRWSRTDVMVPPGSTIVVPKDVNPLETLNIVREITSVLSNLAVSAASIAVISSN